MADFPTSIKTFVNPSASSTQDTPGVYHDVQHSDANDEIAALEAKVGVDNSAVATSIDYKLSNASSSNPGHGHTLAHGATDVTASAAELNYVDGVTSAVQDQLDAKAATSHNHAASAITSGTVDTARLGSGTANSSSFLRGDQIWATASGMLSTAQYAPQGFLINGKIVPSVATSDLTVAIKGMDGNDPSVDNPVYCRIGDTVRTITSALSVTKNDGTNWFDSGSAGLATNEVDYFVYLGYNATDGVTIGFARIIADRYGEFSTTTTNEKYCAISTITNAAADDYYELIGRFTATLSAGAGFTWTVPTFTASNLIQRPIYETRPLAFTPTINGVSSMTIDSTEIAKSSYQITKGKIEIFHLTAYGDFGGSAATYFQVTIPFNRSTTLVSQYMVVPCNVQEFSYSNMQTGYLSIGGTAGKVDVFKIDEANWGLSSSTGLTFAQFSYPI
jgi:hypothetical protein